MCVHAHLVSLVSLDVCVAVRACVSGEGVKECIHGHEVVCVSTAGDLREGSGRVVPRSPFVLNLVFLMDNQGHNLNTITPACLPLSLYFGQGS